MRTFLAVDIEDAVKEKINIQIEEFRSRERNIRWVKPHNIHITLYFFGEVHDSDFDGLEYAIQNSLKDILPFRVKICGFSAFPTLNRPRVLWIGVENPSQELKNIYKGINRELSQTTVNVNRDTKGYTPHITVGRVKRMIDRKIISDMQEITDVVFGTFQIKEVVLYQSILMREGPQYKPFKYFPFQTGF